MVDGGLCPIDSQDGADVRRFVGKPVAVNSKFDLAVTWAAFASRSDSDARRDYVLTFQRFSNAKVFKTVPLPKSAKKSPVHLNDDSSFDGTGNRGWNGRHLLQSVQRNRLFLAAGSEAFVLNLAGLDLPQQPLLMFKPVLPIKLVLGQKLAVPLELTDAALQAKSKFQLVSGPPGAKKLNGAQLTWTPDEASLGEHRLIVTAESGESKDQIAVSVQLRRAAVSLGGVIERLRISPSGERALVVAESLAANATDEPESPRFVPKAPSRKHI